MIASLIAQQRKWAKGPRESRPPKIEKIISNDEMKVNTSSQSNTHLQPKPQPVKPESKSNYEIKKPASLSKPIQTRRKRARRPDRAEEFGGWCDDCKSGENVIQDPRGGTLVCTQCGLVVSNKLISDDAEWRNFSESDRRGADPNRVGGGYDELLGAGANMLTLVGDEGRLAAVQKHQFTSEERKMMMAYDIIKKYTSKLTLPQDVCHCAQELYKQIAESKAMSGKKNLTICATVLYIAAKAGRNARPIRELCEILGVKRKQVTKCYSDIMKLKSAGKLRLSQQRSTTKRQSASSTQEYAVRYANKLRLPGAVVNAARLIVKKVEELAIMTGRQPGTIASACVYLASNLHPNKKHHRSFQEVGLIAQTADSTIQRAYQQFIVPHRSRLIDRSISYAGVRGRKKESLF